MKRVRTRLVVYHREPTWTGWRSRDTPGRPNCTTCLILIFFLLNSLKNRLSFLQCSPLLFFFLLLLCLFLWIGILFQRGSRLSPCCLSACVHAHGCSRLFVCSSTFQKLSSFCEHSTAELTPSLVASRSFCSVVILTNPV